MKVSKKPISAQSLKRAPLLKWVLPILKNIIEGF